MPPLPFDNLAAIRTTAPCGPECFCARELTAWPDYVWCTRRGAPWRIGEQVDCPFYTPRTSQSPPPADEPLPPKRTTEDSSLALFT